MHISILNPFLEILWLAYWCFNAEDCLDLGDVDNSTQGPRRESPPGFRLSSLLSTSPSGAGSVPDARDFANSSDGTLPTHKAPGTAKHPHSRLFEPGAAAAVIHGDESSRAGMEA